MQRVHRRPEAAWAMIAVSALATSALADGPGAHQPHKAPSSPAVSIADGMQAISSYNTGYGLIQRADHFEGLGQATTDSAEREHADREARRAYEASLAQFEEAVRLDPSMHEAHTYLGYANRKLGRHEKALEAYAQALRINPDYPHAIEYQGQAYLGLDRIDDAKFNYLRLYALNPAQAHKLLRAMRAWAEKRPSERELSAWIAERERSHDASAPSSSW